MNPARALPVFCYGLFTLAVQTLLFREFLTSFEGSDISVGLFFGSWFLWIAAGAGITRRETPFAGWLLRRLEFLLLGYLPAVVLQALLTVQARALAGAPAYLLLPLRAVAPLALAVNAPVGLMTGLLFPLVCRWVREAGGRLPVAQVYRIEALGSLAGGAGATLLLGGGWPPVRILLLLAVLLGLAAAVVRQARARGWGWLLLPALLLAALAGGADRPLARRLQQAKWERLLPGAAFGGSFQTAQAEYLYGSIPGQWVVLRDGGVCEVLPGGSGSGRIAALALCQQPRAADILVIGSGLGLCQAFLALDSVRQVTWAQGDPGYMRQLAGRVPPACRVADRRLHGLEDDLRARLAADGARYDLVILNLPDATRSVLNRFYTLEAFRLVRQALRPGGVLTARVSGEANRMGDERRHLGASMRATLLRVFPELVLVPGDESWMLAAEPGVLSGDPEVLQARWSALPGAARLFPPEALHAVYAPARAAAALARYARVPLPGRMLINRDARPLATLYSLLLAARQAGARGTGWLTRLARSGPLVLLAPFLALVLLRPLYVARTPAAVRDAVFAGTWLAGAAGAAGIGITILLMHAYQTRFGSLYLHVGLLSALYMAGLAAGAAGFAARVARHPPPGPVDSSTPDANRELRKAGSAACAQKDSCFHEFQIQAHPETVMQTTVLQWALILAHVVLLALIGIWPERAWHPAAFAAAFLLCGWCAGGYVPLAAGLLAGAGVEAGRAGGRLETADHLGAAAGSLLTGLLLLPLLGTRATLSALALLLLASLPLPALRRATPGAPSTAAPGPLIAWLRRLAYLLAGVGLTVLIGYRHWAGPVPAEPRYQSSDAVMVAEREPVPPVAQEAGPGAAAAAKGKAGAEPPAADLPRLRALIREERLSDREADFYRQVTD